LFDRRGWNKLDTLHDVTDRVDPSGMWA